MTDPHSANGRIRWLLLTIEISLMLAAALLQPLAHLGLADFEARHGAWPELVSAGAVLILARWIYLHFFRREEMRADYEARLQELHETGGPKRMSLTARSAFLIFSLALVIAGSLVPDSNGRALLVVGVPLFILFVLIELSILLRPGETVMPDANDELLKFFKARTLHVGYVTAILSLMALYLIGLFAARYVEMLLPLVLAISLLVPAFAYHRLDRRAGADE